VATIIAATVNIGLNLLLVPRFGIMAAAFDTFVAFALLFGIMLFVGQRIFPIRYETTRLVWLMAAALGLFAVGFFLGPRGFWQGLVFKTGLVLLFPVILWLSGFFTPAERGRVAQLIHAATRRRP
jgi:O-antigen/teichoic acid export membrane protein